MIYRGLSISVDWACRQPIAMLVLGIALFVASLGLARTRLTLQTERSSMLHPRDRYRILAEAHEKEFGASDDFVVLISGGQSIDREHCVAQLLSRLEGQPLFLDVWGRTDLQPFRRRALYYLTEPQLQQLAQNQGDGELPRRWFKEVGLALKQGRPLQLDLLPAQVPEAGRSLLGSDRFRYNSLAGQQCHLVLVRPGQDVVASLRALRAQLPPLQRAHPQLFLGLTGKLVIQADELQCARRDSKVSTVQSCVLILALFALSFSGWIRPLAAFLVLLIGVGWTIGWIVLCIGHLNLLTITFASILVSLGIDFGVHLVLAYEEQRSRGVACGQALQNTMRKAGVENGLGALTSALAFAAICFTDFLAIAELGAIAAAGILLCFLAMVTLFPALLVLEDRYLAPRFDRCLPTWSAWLSRLEGLWLSRPGWVLGVVLLMTPWAGWQASQVGFDHNLLHLQDHRLESIRGELQLLGSNRGALFALSLAANEADARQLTQRFQRLSSVSHVDSVLQLLPEQASRKQPLVERVLKARHAPAQAELARRFSPQIRGLVQLYGPGPVSDVAHQLEEQLQPWKDLLQSQQAQPMTLSQLPASIRLRGVGRTGKLALRIYPRADLWDRQAMATFVREVQSVDPDAGGVALSIFYHLQELKRAFSESGWAALGAISLMLLLYFRSLKLALLALFPKLLGIVWMLASMKVCGIEFNPVNFVGLPMILGIGLIFGVHIVHALLEDPRAGLFAQATGPAVALSALTTIGGFATLIGASHRGIASLGFVMTVGVAANLLASIVVLPCLMCCLKSRTHT